MGAVMPNFIIALAILLIIITAAFGRPGPQWAQNDPERTAWFGRQMMPDNPSTSCCGEADAYYADGVEVVDGTVYAIVTDDRPDEPLGRPHVDVGTRIAIPAHKYKDTRADPNPTGHTILFLGRDSQVYCYLPDGGV